MTLNYNRTYRGKYRMQNGHNGPWAILSKISPMKSVLVINLRGQKDIVPIRLLWRERGNEKSRQTQLRF